MTDRRLIPDYRGADLLDWKRTVEWLREGERLAREQMEQGRAFRLGSATEGEMRLKNDGTRWKAPPGRKQHPMRAYCCKQLGAKASAMHKLDADTLAILARCADDSARRILLGLGLPFGPGEERPALPMHRAGAWEAFLERK
jgi:hypothetical protein